MKNIEKKDKKTRLIITFQPWDEVKDLIPAAMEATGKTKTEIINEALKNLPEVVKMLKAEEKQRLEQIKAMRTEDPNPESREDQMAADILGRAGVGKKHKPQ